MRKLLASISFGRVSHAAPLGTVFGTCLLLVSCHHGSILPIEVVAGSGIFSEVELTETGEAEDPIVDAAFEEPVTAKSAFTDLLSPPGRRSTDWLFSSPD